MAKASGDVEGRVLIVGGGIGGLAAAIALRKVGLEPLVLEQASALGDVGAGVALAPNAMRAITWLGCDALVRETGMEAESQAHFGLESGEHIFTTVLGAEARARYGDGYVCVHRRDLIDPMIAAVPAECVRLEAQVVALEETPDEVCVELASGEVLRGGLLIGADGLKSTVRAALFGAEEPRYTGLVGYRALIPAAEHPEIPVRQRQTIWLGVGRTVIFYPVRRNTLHNFVGWMHQDLAGRESWTAEGDPDDLRAEMDDASEELTTILGAIDRTLLTALFFRDPLDRWGTNRVTLLGDAAHPGIPFSGQGAAMALEDAVTLALLLGRAGGGDPAGVLREYEQRRRPRTTRIQTTARMNMQYMHESDPKVIRVRDGRLRGMLRIDPLDVARWGWIYGNDPVRAVNVPLEQLNAREFENPRARTEARAAYSAWRNALTPEDNAGNWIGQRRGFERFRRELAELPAAVDFHRVDCDGVPGLLIEGSGRPILHLHGGAYTIGSADASREFVARIAAATGSPVLSIDYRLGPEHAFPAAHDDAVTAYRWLVRERGSEAVVTGEEAGGGLALEVALALRDAGEALPAGLHLVSPLVDLTLSAPSLAENGDAWLTREALTLWGGSYIQDVAAPDDPRVSPLFADLSGLPRLVIHAADDEALRDDAIRLAESAGQAGVDVDCRLFRDTVHAFVLFPRLPEATESLGSLAALVE